MATVDSMLSIIGARGADGLTISSGEVPVLTKAGARDPMSMPPLANALVQVFVDEVLSTDQVETLRTSGAVETKYSSEKGEFWTKVNRRGDGYQLAFRPLESSPAVAAAPAIQRPVAAAPAPTPLRPRPQLEVVQEHVPVSEDAAAIIALLHRAQMENASDVLISSGRYARLRIDNRLLEAPECVVSEAALLSVVESDMSQRARNQLEDSGSADFAMDRRSSGLGRYRVNVFRQFEGLAAAFRPVRTDVPTLAQLGLPKELHQLVRYPHGLVLVAGQTGSGKSTTLAALLEYVNRVDAKHIITIEDPIEYHYQSQQSLVHQREVGAHVDQFSTGLRAALRESPDIILVGEMRDPETMAAALTAAETGHLVLSTIHSSDGVVAIDRIIDSFPPHQQRQVRSQLAAILKAVLTQRLLPRVGGGRVPAWETMIVNSAIATMIRDDKCHHIRSQIQTGKAAGMTTMDRTVQRLLQNGDISKAVAAANRSAED